MSCKTYHKVEIAPSKSALLVGEAISGANRRISIVGIYARFLISFNCYEIKVKVTFDYVI